MTARWYSSLVAVALSLPLTGCTRSMVNEDRDWSAIVDSHRHDVEVEGLTLHYIDLGAGEPVVMVHGIADSAYSWRRNAEALVEAGFRVILVDQPGFGRSAIPGARWRYTVENQATAVLGLLHQIGVERFGLVGHSLGGAVSLEMALRHGDRVTRLAVIDPACYRVSCPFGWATQALAAVTGTRWFVDKGLRSAFFSREQVDDVVIDEYARLLDRPGRLGVLGGVCESFFSAEYDRMVRDYGEMKPATLIVWGEEDTWHPLDMGKRLRAAIPGSRLQVLPGAGHNSHQERAELANPILIHFLRGE
jgi:pimeloyl-ACP methyl ester carboxylesterase